MISQYGESRIRWVANLYGLYIAWLVLMETLKDVGCIKMGCFVKQLVYSVWEMVNEMKQAVYEVTLEIHP